MPKSPRLNVTVTPEQHALLLELSELNGGSAASYLRQMLDQATPVLRKVVPMMRETAKATELSRSQAQSMIDELLTAIREAGLSVQPDLLDGSSQGSPGSAARNERQRGRTARRGASRNG